MGKYRMEEPWGYKEENDYESNVPTSVNITGLFSKAEYNKRDNKMYFYDRNNTKCATIDVSEFEEESIVEKAYYDKTTQEIVIEFVNGDVVRINVREVIDETEFKDGLQIQDGQVSVLIDSEGEGYEGNPYLSTSENGVKIAGVDKHIFDAVEEERLRAVSEEERIEAKLDQEISDREADVDAEEARALAAEQAEEARAKREELAINRRIDSLNDALDAEKSIREAADISLGSRVDNEVSRATSSEATIDAKISNEITRATGAESALTLKDEQLQESIDLKADKTEIPTDFYSQEDVNKMVSQLLTRIENLEDNSGVVVADSPEAVNNAAADSNLVITSSDAIKALTSNTQFNTLTIVGGNSNSDIKAIANDKLTVDGMTVNGEKGASNGRMVISANTVSLKNIDIETGSTAYNIFESSQNTAKTEYFTTYYEVSNVTCDNTELNHNIFNIYTPNNNAVINIKDSYFNLDVDKSNVLRLANYANSTGVTVNFENVEWTYENAEGSDWNWAGLIIYQPSSSDAALNGDLSKINTWTFNFKNCKYNGEVVTSNNFGSHNQVVYLYDINKTGQVTDPSGIITINFS